MSDRSSTVLPLDRLVELRRRIHRRPELSGDEAETAARVVRFAESYRPDEIVRWLGGNGVAVVFNGAEPGPTVMIRGDMDALPIAETGACDYRSTIPGVAHLCGHDGHTTMLAGLIPLLSDERPVRGRVVLLFQPAEETGTGAASVLSDPAFAPLWPDYAFALHNLPGYPEGEVLVFPEIFACASVGLVARLEGRTAHAAEPHKGLNPSPAVVEILREWSALSSGRPVDADFRQLTIVHARIGERNLGVSPGEAELVATLRARRDDLLQDFLTTVDATTQGIAERWGLGCTGERVEAFPATANDAGCVERLGKAVADLGVPTRHVEAPMPWSEDFGHFTSRIPGAMFGLGIGEDRPALHRPDYDFPDAVIETGTRLFERIVRSVLAQDWHCR